MTNDWEASHSTVNEWLQRTENLVESTCGNTCTFDELSVDEQLILWEDLEAELTSNEEIYKKAVSDSNALINVMRLGNIFYPLIHLIYLSFIWKHAYVI